MTHLAIEKLDSLVPSSWFGLEINYPSYRCPRPCRYSLSPVWKCFLGIRDFPIETCAARSNKPLLPQPKDVSLVALQSIFLRYPGECGEPVIRERNISNGEVFGETLPCPPTFIKVPRGVSVSKLGIPPTLASHQRLTVPHELGARKI